MVLTRILCVLALAATACTESTFGEGIGRPRIDPFVPPQTAGLSLAEVYITDADPAQWFAEILGGSEDVVVDNFSLCSRTNCVSISGTVTAGARVTFSLEMLTAIPTYDELALLDPTGAVEGYLAWGGHPNHLAPTYQGAALSRGIVDVTGFVPAPFPAAMGISFVEESGVLGCATPTPGAATSAAEITAGLNCPASTVTGLRLQELQPSFDSATGSWAEIANTSGATLNLSGVRICDALSCVTFGPSHTITAAQRILVWAGTDTGLGVGTELFFPEISPWQSPGEYMLLPPGDTFTSVPDFFSFVRSGDPETAIASHAESTGAWPAANQSSLDVRIAGESLALTPGELDTPDSWNPATPTPDADNAVIRPNDPGTPLWTSCSHVKPSQKPVTSSPLRITMVERTNPPQVTIHNPTAAAVDATLWSLESAGVSYMLNTTIDADAVLVVEASTGTCNTSVCWSDPGIAVGESGEITLVDDTTAVRGHIQWGTTTSARGADAVTAGVWPLDDCQSALLPDGAALVLQTGRDGSSPADYDLVQ